jgi:hypothetical protein
MNVCGTIAMNSLSFPRSPANSQTCEQRMHRHISVKICVVCGRKISSNFRGFPKSLRANAGTVP